MNQALALGADRDWINFNIPSTSPVIHQSIKRWIIVWHRNNGLKFYISLETVHDVIIIYSGSVMACEFLVLNGAKINAIDADGNTALHLAALYGSTGQVMIRPYITSAN